MNRRAHLKTLISAAGVLAASPWLTACAQDGRSDQGNKSSKETAGAAPQPKNGAALKLGAQLFTVRSLLRDDPKGTLAALSKIGFAEVEMFGFGGSSNFISDPLFGLTLPEFKRVLADLGLAVPTLHFSATDDGVAQVAQTALELGAHHLIQAMAPEFQQHTADGLVISGIKDVAQVHQLADKLNHLGEICKRSGIGFAYHNHHMEFVSLGDVRAYDILLARTDPGLVQMELDIGWAAVAGVDGAQYLDRYPARFIACHLKDLNPQLPAAPASARSPIPQMTQLVPPGEGTIDFPKVLAAMHRAKVRHGYIEVDLPVGDPMDNCRRGYNYLASLQKR
jgi:sugar phosphate isomerase/epimerase